MSSSKYVMSNDQPYSRLECGVAFEGLTKREKLYAHHIAQASWHGGLIVLLQTSPESPLIFVMLHRMFRHQPLAELKQLAIDKCDFSEHDWQALLVYSSSIYADMGNYRGFGDSKKVPAVARDKLAALVRASAAYTADEKLTERLLDGCLEAIYQLDDRRAQLGLGDKGVSTYFSSNCTQADAEAVTAFMKHKCIEPYNSRLFKTTKNDRTHYEIRLASVSSGGASMVAGDGATTVAPAPLCQDELHNDCLFSVTSGDYSGLMDLVVRELNMARKYAANDHERAMLADYVGSFSGGSLDQHKSGSRHWIKNVGPAVETYIGFIETYRDPTGMRGEFEGFAAIVNRPMSEKFGRLVATASDMLPRLPWPETYEKDVFLKPDFTSLDVLAFSGSGVPSGINIPNYDEIRQSEGFKNVSLGNVISAAYQTTQLPFLSLQDAELLAKHRTAAFEVQVGVHELFGHGSGKLFARDKLGQLNFDVDKVKHAITGEKVDKFYEPGETYDSVFTDLGSAYEECRAEAVGLYLSLEDDVLNIFDVEPSVRATLVYVNWMLLVYSGLGKGLEMYSTETRRFMQAHSQARYVILRVLLEHGDGVVRIEECVDKDGQPDLLLSVDREKISTSGKQAIGDFLVKLQTYKSTADITAARQLFAHYSEVPAGGAHPFLSWIPIILRRKQPRRILVQAGTVRRDAAGDDEADVQLRQYDASAEGMITSYVERFSDNAEQLEQKLLQLHQADEKHFS